MITWRSEVARAQNAIEGHRITCTCQQCGKSFAKYRSEIQAGRGKFCSRKCLGVYTIHQKRPRVSKAETVFGNALEAAGLPVLRSHRIGPWVCDFYVPRTNRVIEFDGAYWHSLPAMKRRDQRKDAWLLSHGYSITRVDERVALNPVVIREIVGTNGDPMALSVRTIGGQR